MTLPCLRVTQPAITCCIQDVCTFNLGTFHLLRGTIYHLNLSFRTSWKSHAWRLLWAFFRLASCLQSSSVTCFCQMLLLLWCLIMVSLKSWSYKGPDSETDLVGPVPHGWRDSDGRSVWMGTVLILSSSSGAAEFAEDWIINMNVRRVRARRFCLTVHTELSVGSSLLSTLDLLGRRVQPSHLATGIDQTRCLKWKWLSVPGLWSQRDSLSSAAGVDTETRASSPPSVNPWKLEIL